jgi:hypothetical protein
VPYVREVADAIGIQRPSARRLQLLLSCHHRPGARPGADADSRRELEDRRRQGTAQLEKARCAYSAIDEADAIAVSAEGDPIILPE